MKIDADIMRMDQDDMVDEIMTLRIFAREFLETMQRFGDWDEGCFYYHKVSASELQHLIGLVEGLKAK